MYLYNRDQRHKELLLTPQCPHLYTVYIYGGMLQPPDSLRGHLILEAPRSFWTRCQDTGRPT